MSAPPNGTKEPKKSTFEKYTGHRRNRTLEKLISASTLMAPTHDRVVGMDPDDVKTPISAPREVKSWDRQKTADELPPLLPQRSYTETKKHNEEEEVRPELPSRPSEIAGYGGAEHMQDKAKESREHILRNGVRHGVQKAKNFVHQDPKAAYFSITEKVDNHLKDVFKNLCNGEDGLRTSELIKFLRETQNQEIEMPVDKTKMREFGMMGEKRWSYKEWLAFMCRSGALEGVRPVGKAGLVRSDTLGKYEETEEEMDALRYPVTSYFIDSSHNTYLQGHQWFSKSTEDAYRYVLVHGCRCIEIDVHNGTSVRDNASGVSSMIKPTAPSELILEASKKKDEIKSSFAKLKAKGKRFYHEKKESLSGSSKDKPKSPRMDEMTREIDMGHRRNQSSNSTVPTFSRDPTSDSEGSAGVHSLEGSAVDLTTDGKPTSEKSSRASSKSSVHPERTGEPIVMHGWTPTTQWCFFRDVCKTVAKYAFETTNMPLIVSLEVACNLDQQELMVKIMEEEWGTMLVDMPLPDCDPAIRQPRLDELFGKILVKVKRHVPHGEEVAENKKVNKEGANPTAPNGGEQVATPSVSDSATLTPSASTPSLQASQLTPNASSTSVSSLTPTATPGANLSPSASTSNLAKLDTGSTKSSTRSRSPSNQKQPPVKIPKICKNLSDLGIYTHSAHFADFFQPSAWSPSHIYSIDESNILKLYEEHAAAMMHHNKKYFMRAYPEWKRIGSSNLDPSVYWRKGVQMAAINAQTWDEGTMVNRGMFEGTGGWVLKPANLRPENRPNKLPTWNPNAKTREEAEAGIDGQKSPLGTPLTEQQMQTSPTTIDSAIDPQPPIGLGLSNAGLESPAPLPEPKVSRATALDPPTPSAKKGRSPRASNASLGSPPGPMSPKSPKSLKSNSAPVSSPKLNSALAAMVMKPAMPKKESPKTVNFFFKIYAAQGLIGDSDMHVRVKIEMHAERDGEYKSDDWKKDTKSRHTTNPDWNGEEIKFLNIGSKGDEDEHIRGHIYGPREDLSFVRFKLEDDNTLKKDVMLAWRAIRLDRLRTGYRFLRLWNARGEEGGGLLLIHVRREEV